MNPIRSIAVSIQHTVRYKLLALVLFPILLVMPLALMLAIYWGSNITYDQLFFKVNTDLSVAHDAFERIQQDYLDLLARQAESYEFRVAMEVQNRASVQRQIETLRRKEGFSYLQVLNPMGDPITDVGGKAPISPLYLLGLKGRPVSGIEIFSPQDLLAIGPELARSVRLVLIETPRAGPSSGSVQERGMMIRMLYPVMDSRGEVAGVLDGGVLLNSNFAFVDEIRDLVYGAGSLPQGSIGAVTVFLDDVRISTNVPLGPGERALGTRASREVRMQVLDDGDVWIDRAFVVNDWYISAYEPILDAGGQRVGMLHAGFLETPFRSGLWRALAVLVVLFILLMTLSSLVAVRGAKTIFRPLEAMSGVMRATRDGRSRRIGTVSSRDEIGELAREFDSMLNLLEQRNREIQGWAEQLEHKVKERTAELESRNEDLSRTIRLLRQTRRRLLVAEKLAAVGELTAGVAHEINNPTAVILGNMDLIVSELGEAAEPVRNEISLIIEQIYRIQEIINNLLKYARPGELSGYLSELDVNPLVRDTLKLVQHMQKNSSFAVDLELEASRPIRINQQELQQVIVNLLVNGIHALVDGKGSVCISTRDWDETGVVIHVMDNGIGMDEDQLSQIFNPFYSTREEGDGTGLGLSVSYGLIRRYGGDISVRSSPGKGSRFSVWLLSKPVLITDEETIMEQLRAIEEEEKRFSAG